MTIVAVVCLLLLILYLQTVIRRNRPLRHWR